jgi:formate C-acetyltransferase
MSAQGAVAISEPGSRVERLRNRIVEATHRACIERARYLTRSMAENWDEHPLTRMSMALQHILENITVIIRDGELVVGCRTSRLKGAPFFPENKSRWIEEDLDRFEERTLQRVAISADAKRELREEILPFWRDRTVEKRLEAVLPPDLSQDMNKFIFTMMLEITYGIGHFTMNHPRILRTGLAGVIAEATRRYRELAPEDQGGERGCFYDAVVRSARAAIRFAHRHADLAEHLAGEETDPLRAEELRTIAAVCRRVPEHPARSFREAIQCVYFIHLIAQIESGGNSISLGRIDQILFPYYQADRSSGAITPDDARELLALLFLKTNEIWNILEEPYIPGGEGMEGKTTQNVTVGGMGIDGRDATNELSRIGLDAFAEVRTVQPNFGVRLAPDAPDDFLLEALRHAKDGVPLHLFNDEAIVESLRRAGHSLEDARDYGMVGCLEPNAQGKSFGSTFAVQFNGIKCLELALNDGMDNVFGYRSGIASGALGSFSHFEDVWKAYDAQLTHFMGQMARGMEIMDGAIAELVPSPFASAVIDGPMEKGLDLTRGGAIYNSTGVQLIGFSNVVDSLHALKKGVFEDGVASARELSGLLASNWDGAEDKRAFFLNKISKYGNDDDEVDALAARVLTHFCDRVLAHENYRGGRFWPGVFSVGFHIAMGAVTGATPDGRLAGEALGNGITPSNGKATTGPTAIINSVTKLPLAAVCNGSNLNMRFNPMSLRPENLQSLMKTYFRKGGVQVQFNMIDSSVLRDAQKHPERYRDLVVRVSGYSALFTGMSEAAQNEIISRIECAL